MHPAIARRLAVQRQGRDDGSGDPITRIVEQIAVGGHDAQDRALRIIHAGDIDSENAERLANAVADVWMRELPGRSAGAVVDDWGRLFGVERFRPWNDERDGLVDVIETFARTLVRGLAQTPVPATRQETMSVVLQDMFEPLADQLADVIFQLDAPKVLRRWFKDETGLGTVSATGAISKIDRTLFRAALDEVRFDRRGFDEISQFVLSRPGAHMLAKNEYANRVENALKADLEPGVPSRIPKATLRAYYDIFLKIRSE